MVLEHLFPANWLEKKSFYAFLLAIGYSIIGIVLARLLFGGNSGIVSVMFTSILLIPVLRKIFKEEENAEEKERKFTLKELYKDNKNVIKTYMMIFLGIFTTYLFFSFILPQFGVNTFNVFKEQLFLDAGLRGHAYNFGTFWSILMNNWWVLIACFLLGLLTGDGAIFFITWNASAWGTIFGYRALNAAIVEGANPWGYLALLLLIVIWHIILEGGAYIVVATAGSVISDNIIKKSKEVRKFLVYAGGIGMFAFLFMIILRGINKTAYFIISALVFLGILYGLGNTFEDKKHKEVFTYNFWLFVIGILIFVIGALVETSVLSWSGFLNKVYMLSYLY